MDSLLMLLGSIRSQLLEGKSSSLLLLQGCTISTHLSGLQKLITGALTAVSPQDTREVPIPRVFNILRSGCVLHQRAFNRCISQTPSASVQNSFYPRTQESTPVVYLISSSDMSGHSWVPFRLKLCPTLPCGKKNIF